MRRKIFRRILHLGIAVLTVGALVAGVAFVGNDYRFAVHQVVIPGPAGSLDGVVALPSTGRPSGVVLMVHGDGPVNATRDGLYHPWFEGAADAGFATVAWSKPGVGASAGDWLTQSMPDRSREVAAVLDWLRERPDLAGLPVVLWGASQAGWVVPSVAAAREEVRAVVAVGTAIDWRRQGRFHLRAELDHSGAPADERARAIAESDRTLALLERGATNDDYRASTTDAEPMSRERWGFVLANFRSDVTPDLPGLALRGIPVHLMAGEDDRNVHVAETERVYRSALGASLSVSTFPAAHSLARPLMEDSDPVGVATGVIWPRGLLAPGVIDDYRAFLRSVR